MTLAPQDAGTQDGSVGTSPVPPPGRPTPSGTVGGRWRVVAIAVAATCWSLAGASAVIFCLRGEIPPTGVAPWLLDVLTAVVYGGTTLLMLPRSRHPVAWILLVSALGAALSGFASQYALLAADHGLPAPALVQVLPAWTWFPGQFAVLAVLPWLVSPRRPPRWVLAVVTVAVCSLLVRTAFLAVARYPGYDNPIALGPGPLYRFLYDIGGWQDRLCVVLSLAAIVRLWWLRRGAPGDEGRGYGWLVIGQSCYALSFVPTVFRTEFVPMSLDLTGLGMIAAQAFLPAALMVVVLGQRLWGVDAAVSRAAVWLLLTGAVVGGYVILVWLGQQWLPAEDRVTGTLAAAAVLAASQPVRHLIERRVDHLVYGPAQDPAVLLRALSHVAGGGPGRMLDALVDALAGGLRLGGVEVRGTGGEVVARTGRLHRADLVLPLVVEGRRRGDLVVAAARGQALDARTRRMVEQMGSVLAVVLELAQVNDRLSAARDRLLEVRHEERRLLRRDLHDGVGPALAGIGLGLEAAQRRLGHDPEAGLALLEELKVELDRRTHAIRLLAHSVLPPQLDAGDLAQALALLARRYQSPGLAVTTCCGVPDLDPRRQIAVYHVTAEALANAHRHGRASRVDITVRGTGDGVELEVVDDGVGMPVERTSAGTGVGLHSMRERAEELGGRLEVGPGRAGHGTRVRMVLP